MLAEAVRVALVAIALAVGVGAIRGLPAPPPPVEEALSCAPPTSAGTAQPHAGHVAWVTQDEAARLLASGAAVFVDARGREEFERGHVTDALNAPIGESGTIDERLVPLLRGRTVVAYCDTAGGCTASTRVAHLLVIAGIPDVRVLEGGIGSWLARGAPAQAGPCRLCP